MAILIVDDHALIREGIASVVRSIRSDVETEAAASCAAALDAIARRRFELVLLDLNLPDQPGFRALERLREGFPETPVVVVSGQEDRATVLKALELGARSFVPKSLDADRLRSVLTEVLDGQVRLPASLVVDAEGGSEVGPGGWDLTDRQFEVLRLVVAGLPNKLIARRLDIAESTVKIHVSAILRALRVGSRTQALIAVARSGVRL